MNEKESPLNNSSRLKVHSLTPSSCTSYLIPHTYVVITPEEQGILIDPGPALFFQEIRDQLRALLPLKKVVQIIVTNPYPGAISSLPYWAQEGMSAEVTVHWKTGIQLQFIGNPFITHPLYKEGETRTVAGEQVFFHHSRDAFGGINTCIHFKEREILFSGMFFGAVGADDPALTDLALRDRRRKYSSLFLRGAKRTKRIVEIFGEEQIDAVYPHFGPVFHEDLKNFSNEPASAADEPDKELIAALEEVEQLKTINFELQESIILAKDARLRDGLTGLYNEYFLIEALKQYIVNKVQVTLYYVRIDNIKTLNRRFGLSAGDESIQTLGRLLQERQDLQGAVFRGTGPSCILLVPQKTSEEAAALADAIRNDIAESERFISSLTVSIALVRTEELGESQSPEILAENILKTAKDRLKVADKRGGNVVVNTADLNNYVSSIGKILVLDGDPLHIEVTKGILERAGFEVISTTKGAEALQFIDLYNPDVVVSEIYLPQLDVFQIRQRVLESSDLKDIPFVLLSFHKNEDTIKRAHKMGMFYYFKRPVMLEELTGVITELAAGMNDGT